MTGSEPGAAGPVPGSGFWQSHFRGRLMAWDTGPRLDLPRISGGLATHLWRGPDQEFPALYRVCADEWEAALNAREAGNGAPVHPGTSIPTPAETVVRGFSLSPDGHTVAALLSRPDSELAGLWILAETGEARVIAGVRSWYSTPVWSPGQAAVWMLDGKPPHQRIVRCELGRPEGSVTTVPFPAGCQAAPSAGRGGPRFTLGSRAGRLTLLVTVPGTGQSLWEHNPSGAWQKLAEATPGTRLIQTSSGGVARVGPGPVVSVEPLPAAGSPAGSRAPARPVYSGAPGSTVLLVAHDGGGGLVIATEDDGVTSVRVTGREPLVLGSAEQLRGVAVSGSGLEQRLWLHTASPENPSRLRAFPLDPGPGGPLEAGLRPADHASTTGRAPAAGRGNRASGRGNRASGRANNTAGRGNRAAGIVHRRLLATASDGVQIPLIVSVPADALDVNGRPACPRPLIMSCYGGFGVHHRTEAEPSVPAWLEHGGIYVSAQLRGGGERGPRWHEAGRGVNKQRTMADLIDCARYLSREGWTRPEWLTAAGASHGGLVVLSAALQEPVSFGGVVATAPLLDVVDLDRHGLGPQWLHEFGADGECAAEVRAAYSPVHLLERLDDDAQLPPMLCCVMGSDERVDNGAVRQFVDGLRHRGGRAWLRSENDSVHGSRAAGSVLDFSAAVLGFAAGVAAEAGFTANSGPGVGPGLSPGAAV